MLEGHEMLSLYEETAPGCRSEERLRLCSAPHCLHAPGLVVRCFIPAKGTRVTCHLRLAKLDSLLSQREEEDCNEKT